MRNQNKSKSYRQYIESPTLKPYPTCTSSPTFETRRVHSSKCGSDFGPVTSIRTSGPGIIGWGKIDLTKIRPKEEQERE